MTEDNVTSMRLFESTRERLRDRKIIERESFDDCLNRLLDDLEE